MSRASQLEWRFASAARVLTAVFSVFFCAIIAQGADLTSLKVLYVGDAGSARAHDFESFLKLNTAKVAVANRDGFQPAEARNFDVVLLDWPQTGRAGDFPPKHCPLGSREKWDKPTVLLGSAGLNLAVAWKAKGGSG